VAYIDLCLSSCAKRCSTPPPNYVPSSAAPSAKPSAKSQLVISTEKSESRRRAASSACPSEPSESRRQEVAGTACQIADGVSAFEFEI